jgi:hypothetical protein
MDYAKFEELSGIELGMFVSDVIKRCDVDEGVLAYYQHRRTNLDDPHLEMIILLLEKVGTFAALNEVASLLDHPTKFVRYQAAHVIANASSLDENAMAKVICVLSSHRYPNDIIKIEDALLRGGTKAARTLATCFRDANR